MLGVPLHPEAEGPRGILADLDCAVIGAAGDDERPRIGDGLVVRGVHHDGASAEDTSRERFLLDRRQVVYEVAISLNMDEFCGLREVLHERPP